MSNSQSGDFQTPYGVIHASNPGPVKAYDNLRAYAQSGSRQVLLQGPALRAFKAAELRITPPRMKKKGKVRPILITGVGFRSYALQKELWESDKQRFADPDLSNHVEGLAVDCDTGYFWYKLGRVQKALKAEGFIFGVDGEPWHASFRLSG